MAQKELIVAFGLAVAASPLLATNPEPTVAPAGTTVTKYCMYVEPITGSRIETVECWTRQEWAEQEVDVDKEWAEEGVAIIDEAGRRLLKS